MTGKFQELPANYINRELSWLEFNARVLEEAQDQANPLFERLKFASIVASNLDEFYMVRVASLWDQVSAGYNKPDPSGLTPVEQLQTISVRVHRLMGELYSCYIESLIPELGKANVLIHTDNLTIEQKEYLDRYYWETIFPVLTPLVIDSSRSFPLILNKSLNIALLLKNLDETREPILATVQVPSVLDRLVEVPTKDGVRQVVFLEDVIKIYVETLFRGHTILTLGSYRITRNADLGLEEEEAEDLLKTIEESVKMRKWSAVVRLEVEAEIEEELRKVLETEMEVPADSVFMIPGPLDLTFLMRMSGLSGFEHLRFEPLKPQIPELVREEENIFESIKKQDIILHHPFESFDPVVELVQQAARDPQVLAIKQTLYRVSGNSPIVEALGQAAENGKQVTVLVELKARFDEENNIIWARRLEKAGCQVIYGLVGLKTHCKALLVVRREEDGIKRYIHLGTGNYNDVTAKFYTDLGLMTVNPYFAADISSLFNMLSGYSRLPKMYKVSVAPVEMDLKFQSLIEQEMRHARKGREARIIAKMNSLVDEQIIQALYDASRAGVEIDLIVRGICSLRPGVPGLSERIRVRSVVGRFLEHHRIFYFANDGDELIYLSSADWMPRNLYRRVELLFPVEEEGNKEKVKQILQAYLRDNVKARVLNPDGTYSRIVPGDDLPLNSQEYLYKWACGLIDESQWEEVLQECVRL